MRWLENVADHCSGEYTVRDARDRVCPGTREPDRRAHRLQRRSRAAVRDQPRASRCALGAATGRGSRWSRPTSTGMTRSRSPSPTRSRLARLRPRRRGRAAGGRLPADRRPSSRSPAPCRAAPACRHRRRSRSRSAWRCWASAARRCPDRIRAGADLLAGRERLGRRPDRPARSDRLAVRRARPARCGSTSARSR